MFNEQQQLAFDYINSMEGADKLRLDGEGGCGKTYVLVKTIEHLVDTGKSVLVVAPTHMARQGLVNKVREDIRHLVPNRTLASLLGRFGMRTMSGDTAFSKAKTPAIDSYDLVVIDEISMMSAKDLLALVNTNTPIVFSGDLRQLPVVRQKKAVWDEIPVIKLTEQVRQSGVIHALAQELRHDVRIPTMVDAHPEQGLHIVSTKQELIDKMVSEIQNDPDEVWAYRYLTYTNKEIFEVNARIRKALYGDQTSEPFIPGEFIILQQTCSAGYNTEILRIESIDVVAPNSAYPQLTDYFVTFENGHTLRVLSPSDRLAMNDIRKKTQEMLVLARKLKNGSAVASYMKELEYLDYNWVDINYCYATTVHKSQGQTIPHVYVNMDALSKASNKRALLYVAISRASEELWLNEVPTSNATFAKQLNDEYKALDGTFELTHGMTYRQFVKAVTGDSLRVNKNNRQEVNARIKTTSELLKVATLGIALRSPELLQALVN